MFTAEATWLLWMGRRIMSGDKMICDLRFAIYDFKPKIESRNSKIQERGFTLIGLAVIIAIMGIVLMTVSRVYSTMVKRDVEEELLFRGDEIKDAIDSYFKYGNIYPKSFDDLLKDPRGVNPKKHLRKLYQDPITKGEWDVIKDKAERIVGVRSKSEEEPLKKAGFPHEYKTFEGKTKYNEWEFISKPISTTP